MTYKVRSFDLSGVVGLSKRAIDVHLGLYKTYVEKLNALLEQAPKGDRDPGPLAWDGYNRRYAFEYNGVVLHELFFEQLAGKHREPGPESELVDAMTDSHGGFSRWQASIEALANTRGVGWVLTLRERGEARLRNCWIDLHHLHMPANAEIVFVLDLWEHAFMFDFTAAQRSDYVKIVLENVDWPVVEQRYRLLEAREHTPA